MFSTLKHKNSIFKNKEAILLIYLFSEKCKELKLSNPLIFWSGGSILKTPEEMTQMLFRNEAPKTYSLNFCFENSGFACVTKTENSYHIEYPDNKNAFTESDPAEIINHILIIL